MGEQKEEKAKGLSNSWGAGLERGSMHVICPTGEGVRVVQDAASKPRNFSSVRGPSKVTGVDTVRKG